MLLFQREDNKEDFRALSFTGFAIYLWISQLRMTPSYAENPA